MYEYIYLTHTCPHTMTDRWDLHAPDLINQRAAVILLFVGSWKEKERKCWRPRVSGSLSFNLFTAMTSGAPEWALRTAGWGLKAWPTERAQSQPRRLSRLYLKLAEGKNQRGERKGGKKKGWKEGKRERERGRKLVVRSVVAHSPRIQEPMGLFPWIVRLRK